MNDVQITVAVKENLGVLAKYDNEIIYGFIGECKRLSGAVDAVKITYSSLLYQEIKEGYHLVTGELRKTVSGLYIYATHIEKLDAEPEQYVNEVNLKGTLYTAPKSHNLSKSGTQIADFKLKVMRNSVKFDVLPCIVWKKQAIASLGYNVGDTISLRGRVQSKTRLSSSVLIEVSCNYISKVGDEDEAVIQDSSVRG